MRPSRNRRPQQSTPKPKPKPKLRILSPRCQIDEMMNGDLYQIILDAVPELEKELLVQAKEKWSTASAVLGNCDGSSATTPKKFREAPPSYSNVAIIKGYYAVVSALLVDIYKYLPPTTAPFLDEMENRFKRVKAAATDLLQLRKMYNVVPKTITSNGNFSDVYEGTERGGLERAVCIKMLKLLGPGQQDISDIKNEESMAKCMSSPFFAKLLHSSSNDFIPFMVSEYLHGGELADYAKSVSLKQRRKDLPKLLRRVAACLLQLHVMEIIHRDIKDENMAFRGEPGNFDDLVAFDLGLSRKATRSSDTYCGTKELIAPEIERAGGEKGIKLTPAVDMYSAMVMVVRFIVLEGLEKLQRNPKTEAYDLDDVRDLLADHQVPEQFISLICKGLTSKPTSRLTALELHKHESLSGVPDPFDCQDLNPLKWVIDLAAAKALNEESKKKSESDAQTIAKLIKENGKGQKRIAKLEVQIDDLQSSARANGVVEGVAAAAAVTGGNDACFFAKVPLLVDVYNGVMKDLAASAKSTAAKATVNVARSAVKNEMLRRLVGAECPITPADIDRFFCLGNPIPEGKRVGRSFSRENPVPSEIPSEDRIDNEKDFTGVYTRDLLESMGMKRGQDSPKRALKDIVRPWWDSEIDGDEEGASSETEDDETAA